MSQVASSTQVISCDVARAFGVFSKHRPSSVETPHPNWQKLVCSQVVEAFNAPGAQLLSSAYLHKSPLFVSSQQTCAAFNSAERIIIKKTEDIITKDKNILDFIVNIIWLIHLQYQTGILSCRLLLLKHKLRLDKVCAFLQESLLYFLPCNQCYQILLFLFLN